MRAIEMKKLLGEIKKAIIIANNEGDSFRVGFLKYSRRQVKRRLYDFYREHGIIPADRPIQEMFNQ